MKEESLLLLSDLQKLINQVVLIDYTIIILGGAKLLTTEDMKKYHTTAERILNALDNSPVPISWHEMDRCALQSVIAKELILIDKEAR